MVVALSQQPDGQLLALHVAPASWPPLSGTPVSPGASIEASPPLLEPESILPGPLSPPSVAVTSASASGVVPSLGASTSVVLPSLPASVFEAWLGNELQPCASHAAVPSTTVVPTQLFMADGVDHP
jgi:hypothetical protein